MVIRNITESDIEKVVEIQISSWQTSYKGIVDDEYLRSMNKEKNIEKIKQNYKQNGFIVAEIDNEIVGFCRYIDGSRFTPEIAKIDCELCALYIKNGFKRKGTGKALFGYVVDEFIGKNKTKMVIWCLKENVEAQKFYEKMGGKSAAEKEVLIGNKNYKEVAFVYDLKNLKRTNKC